MPAAAFLALFCLIATVLPGQQIRDPDSGMPVRGGRLEVKLRDDLLVRFTPPARLFGRSGDDLRAVEGLFAEALEARPRGRRPSALRQATTAG